MVSVETKRGLGADEEPYSRTVTIPDDGIAPVSAENMGTGQTLNEWPHPQPDFSCGFMNLKPCFITVCSHSSVLPFR
jgi:hypothetical protein